MCELNFLHSIAAMAHSSFETWVQSSRGKFQGLLRQAHDKLLGIAQSLQEHAKGNFVLHSMYLLLTFNLSTIGWFLYTACEEQEYSIHKDQQEKLEEQLEELKSLDSAVREELTCAYRKDTVVS